MLPFLIHSHFCNIYSYPPHVLQPYSLNCLTFPASSTLLFDLCTIFAQSPFSILSLWISSAHITSLHYTLLPRPYLICTSLSSLCLLMPCYSGLTFAYSFQATNMKTGLRYCLYRIHGYRLNNVKVTQLVDLWKKLQHSSVTQLREVFTTKAFGDNCKSYR